ncbi:MAG: endonuclease/exonuclease/phosphatase family protein [Planctomycetaceae bacterium]
MIRSLLAFHFRPWPFAKGIPRFCLRWLVSRSPLHFLLGIPSLAVTLAIVATVLMTRSPESRKRLATDYRQRAALAVNAGDLQQAEILYRRAIPLSSDPNAVTVEFAAALLGRGQEARGLRMLTALAPIDGRSGYLPAYQALAAYYRDHPDRTALHDVLTLRYRMETEADSLATRLELVSLLATHGAYSQAIGFLRPVADDNAGHELLLARLLEASGQRRQAADERNQAIARMRDDLRRNPDDAEQRRRLLNTYAEQGRLFDALTVALEGCDQSVDPATVDMVIDVYSAWMTTLPPREVREQLNALRMTVDPQADTSREYTLTSITRADGTDRMVHECFAGLHRVLLSRDSQWLVDLLLGTAAAGDNRPQQAMIHLRRAHAGRPDHPVIANDLAWMLYRQASRDSGDSADALLNEAIELADIAVAQKPDHASFHDTRAQILIAAGCWLEAESELQRCDELGGDTSTLRRKMREDKKESDTASDGGTATHPEHGEDSDTSEPGSAKVSGSHRGAVFTKTALLAGQRSIRFATFNASLNRRQAGELVRNLSKPNDRQAMAVAEIIRRVRPDVLLLNEFDFDENAEALRLFQDNYLNVPRPGIEPIRYEHHFLASPNTGVPSGLDLDNDGTVAGGNDAFGFGEFPGQYGMVLLSQFPIVEADVRTFQKFLWKDMPGNWLPPDPADSDGDGNRGSFYSPAELNVLRLSSKSHWDVPIDVDGFRIHVLASHPTPPVFDDGAETDFEHPTIVDRNGRRNHDEIRFLADYISGAEYIYDDSEWAAAGNTTPAVRKGGLLDAAKFVILGDLNADPIDGDNTGDPIDLLLSSPLINAATVPRSDGGAEASRLQQEANTSHRGDPSFDTADFNDSTPGNLRIDYVLPSATLTIQKAEVYWPTESELRDIGRENLLGPKGGGASDHRLVFVDIDVDRPEP